MFEIVDNNGTLYSGNIHEMQLIWDLITRDIEDLKCEYRRTYSEKHLKLKKEEYKFDWEGDLKLIEIHSIKTKDENKNN